MDKSSYSSLQQAIANGNMNVNDTTGFSLLYQIASFPISLTISNNTTLAIEILTTHRLAHS